jgi:hypothetical protein
VTLLYFEIESHLKVGQDVGEFIFGHIPEDMYKGSEQPHVQRVHQRVPRGIVAEIKFAYKVVGFVVHTR